MSGAGGITLFAIAFFIIWPFHAFDQLVEKGLPYMQPLNRWVVLAMIPLSFLLGLAIIFVQPLGNIV